MGHPRGWPKQQANAAPRSALAVSRDSRASTGAEQVPELGRRYMRPLGNQRHVVDTGCLPCALYARWDPSGDVLAAPESALCGWRGHKIPRVVSTVVVQGRTTADFAFRPSMRIESFTSRTMIEDVLDT